MTNETIIKDNTANPAPLGLFAFGMTTVLLNLHNAGFYELNSMIMAMGICYGGVAQVIVGIMEWKKKNTFGTVAFTSYGLFWLSLVVLWVLPKVAGVTATDKKAVGCYLVVWGLFTFILLVGALKTNKALITVFATLTLLFFLLAAGDFTGNAMWTTIAGYEGIFTGLSAIYLGAAQVLNEMHGRTVLPIGECPKA
ncbi:MAG: acetate uptake transporter [Verrucomicrobiota bacterium]